MCLFDEVVPFYFLSQIVDFSISRKKLQVIDKVSNILKQMYGNKKI